MTDTGRTVPPKMLTLWQPWASLIVVGAKTIETRSWSTDYRGPLVIHAAKRTPTKCDLGEWYCDEAVVRDSGSTITRREWGMANENGEGIYYRLPLGSIVAIADLVDVVPMVGEWPNTQTDCVYPGGVVCGKPPGHGAPTLWTHASYRGRSPEERSYDGARRGIDIADQLPFGDFRPGRFAWLLDNVRPVEPIPCRGHQGLRDCPIEVTA